jgi:ABC-type Na+ efflux pump permease subunit
MRCGQRVMETIYDWLTMAVFAGLIVLFLNRSTAREPVDSIWHYIPPSIACACANYFGNKGFPVVAILFLLSIAVYLVLVLKVRLPSR